MSVSRRELLAGAVATGAVAAASSLGGSWADASPAWHHHHDRRLPRPARSGLDHIVVLLMENRSFDHFLGWVPGADGVQAGLRYPDDTGALHRTHHLHEWQGCGFNDPDHSYDGGRVQFDGGRLDGFRRGDNDDYALGYYKRRDLATMSQLVRHFTVCDRWFASILGPTFPNRIYTHSASTDRISNTYDPIDLPSIWDRLAAAGIPANYYYSDLPVLALYRDQKYAPISKTIDTFFTDAEAGRLPAYSYVDPSFIGEDEGSSNDDHPHADIRRGQNLIARVVKALTESPQWRNTALIVTYDEWGGFFDHVRPPRFPDDVNRPGGDKDHPDHAQAGFRVPAFIVSPFAPKGRVAHTTFEHSAILKLVEWRFGLKPLTKRDRASNNLAHVLDFRCPNLRPPTIVVPPDPGPHLCGPGVTSGMSTDESMWRQLAASRRLDTSG